MKASRKIGFVVFITEAGREGREERNLSCHGFVSNFFVNEKLIDTKVRHVG